LLVVAERRHGVVQIRTVILIALPAIVRKLMIIDLSSTDDTATARARGGNRGVGQRTLARPDQDRRDDVETVQSTEP
jgi:hypothetical protein